MAPDDITPGADGTGQDPSEEFEYIEEVVEYKDTRWLRTLLVVILIILLLLLGGIGYLLWNSSRVTGGAATSKKADKMTWVRSIYGWGAAQDQQLSAPTAVAAGPDGLIWANSSNRLAVAFNRNGTFDRILMSNPATSTSKAATGGADAMGAHPGATPTKANARGVTAVFSLDVDPNNNLFIGDDAAGNVLKFTPDGKLLQGWSIPGFVKIAVNESEVAVLGRGNLGVFKQDTGAPVFEFGTRGQGAEQFDLPVGVHIDEQGFVYVADTQNRRVRKYTPSGRLVWEVGKVPDRQFESHVQGTQGEFQLPTGVTTDANGRVVVTDAFNYDITVLNGADGKKIASYGEYGPDDGQFDNPSAIDYDPKGDYFVVADTGNNRVQVVRIPGSAKLTPTSAMSRAFANPLWILCLPFIILLIAALVTYLVSRRRKRDEAAAAARETESTE